MGDEPDRRKMLERLFAFMEERGTPIVAVPTISKIAVDLYKLYHIVRSHGGMVEVCTVLNSELNLKRKVHQCLPMLYQRHSMVETNLRLSVHMLKIRICLSHKVSILL